MQVFRQEFRYNIETNRLFISFYKKGRFIQVPVYEPQECDNINQNYDIMALRERIRQYIGFRNLSVREFEQAAGLSNGSVSKMGDNTRRSTIDSMCNAFPDLNRVWLLTGRGHMLNDDATETAVRRVICSNERGEVTGRKRLIKYFPEVDTSMGEVEYADNPDERFEWMLVPGLSEGDFAVNAYGDSMDPMIKSGQIVFLSIWRESFIDWGHIYLVCTRSGYRAIKRLEPGNDDEHIRCCSINPLYKPFDVERADITHIYIVKSWMCRNTM